MTTQYATIIDELLAREYGALVLRQYVNKHMMRGVIIASVTIWAMAGGFYLYQYIKELREADEGKNAKVVYIDPTKLAIPPIVDQPKVEQLLIKAPDVAPPVSVVPKAVEDSKVADTVKIMEVKDIAAKIDEGRTQVSVGTGSGTVVAPIEEEYIPKSDEFVAVEKDPEQISKTQPVYPELARSAGITGTVMVQFLVNKRGEVTQVKVVKANPPGMGFEDAAVAAVKQWKYKPAINNGSPIAVWVTQPVRFKLGK